MEFHLFKWKIIFEIEDAFRKPSISEIRRYPGYENAYYDSKGKLIKE